MDEPRDNGEARACQEVRADQALDFLSGLLTPEEREIVETHLSSCPDCRQRLEEIRIMEEALTVAKEAQGLVPVPERVDRAIDQLITEEAGVRKPLAAAQPPSRSWPVAITAAAVVLALVSGFYIGLSGLVVPRVPVPGADSGESTEKDPGELISLKARLRELQAESVERLSSLKDRLTSETLAKTDLQGKLKISQEEVRRLRSTVSRLDADLRDNNSKFQALAAEYKITIKTTGALQVRVEDQDKILKSTQELLKKERKRLERMEQEVASSKASVLNLTEVVNRFEASRQNWGDANGDGRTDVRDVLAICSSAVDGKALPYRKEADLNADGKIDVGDALLIAGLSFSENR